MTTLKNIRETKLVNISKTETGYIAMYCQVNNEGAEQVLESKRYATLKRIEKWAQQKLA